MPLYSHCSSTQTVCLMCSRDRGSDVCWSVSRLIIHGALRALAPKFLHGVVLKFRGKFIFLNLYPAVCWRRHCTYEFFFSVVILPKFYEYQLKVSFASSPYTLRDKHQFRLFKLRVLRGRVDRRRTK